MWEGRHKSSLVNAEQYLLKCYRYIEFNPVSANMVDHPGDYKWSSYRANARGERNALLQAHDIYLAIANTAPERQAAYRELFTTCLDKDDIHAIRESTRFSMPLGNNRFKEQIEQALKIKLGQAKRGRPRIEEEMAIYYV